MNPKQHRILPARFEIGRLHEPSLYLEAIRGLRPDLLNLTELHTVQNIVIKVNEGCDIVRSIEIECHQVTRPVEGRVRCCDTPIVRNGDAGDVVDTVRNLTYRTSY